MKRFTFEGYGPGGVALLVERHHRQPQPHRKRNPPHLLARTAATWARAGSVAWMFHKKGDIVVPKAAAKEDELMNIVLKNGGEDLNDEGDTWEILTDPECL